MAAQRCPSFEEKGKRKSKGILDLERKRGKKSLQLSDAQMTMQIPTDNRQEEEDGEGGR